MVNKIRLFNFRNLIDKTFEFSEKVTVIVGPNATGKTNLLESIYLLGTGKSFRADESSEMINYNENLARVKGKINKEVLEVILTRGTVKVGEEKIERTPKKKFLVNGVSKRVIDFKSVLKVVLFAPHDLELVTESPSVRRKFLDAVLSQTDREYYRALLSYEKGLRQRNRLLYSIREEGGSRTQLHFWDQLLIKNGDYINNKRREFIDFANRYESKIPDSKLALYYDASVISEARLKEYEHEEVAAATTLVGPHRDDFLFEMNGRDLSKFGSRGEERMGVLWLKLAELAFIFEKTEEKPTLLLDDIFSELDESHREIVFEVAADQQTIITTSDPDFLVDMGDILRIEF
jgi:DNA replication and repair protein RecF